jgi:hypothetical protein
MSLQRAVSLITAAKEEEIRKIGTKLGTRNIMSLQRAVSLITAAKEEEIRKIGTKLVHGTL